MSRLRDELLAHERQARRSLIITVLTETLPGLAEDDAATVLTALRADRGIPLRQLDEHLAARLDALISEDPSCPAVIVRLVHALRDSRPRQCAVLPGCTSADGRDVPLPRFGPGGGLPPGMRSQDQQEKCGRCGRTARIFARRDEGGIAHFLLPRRSARSSKNAQAAGVSECPSPGGRMVVAFYLDCWEPPTYPCVSCGTVGPAKARDEAGRCARTATGTNDNHGGPAESAERPG